jgi:hypothetical protein
VLAFATGQIGLSPGEFWALSWAEYDVMCEGYAKKQEERNKLQWEATRWMTFYLLNIQVEKNKRIKRLTDLVRFPWEKEQPRELPTREEFEELCNRWGKTLA